MRTIGRGHALSDLLLDTCAVIWTGNGDPIAPETIEVLNKTQRKGHKTHVSPFSAWELGLLVARDRVRLERSAPQWFEDYVRRGGICLAALSPRILVDSSFLPGSPPGDPVDRIIIATARALNLTIVTHDRLILSYASEGHVSVLRC